VVPDEKSMLVTESIDW